MGEDLQAVSSALGERTDSELHALIDATNGVPQIAPGLLSWIEPLSIGTESHGQDCAPRPREAAIPPEEDAASIYAAMAMRSMFAQDTRAPAALALLHAIVELLTGGEGKH